MSDRRYTAIFSAAVLTAGVATFSVYRLLRSAAEPRREPTRTVVLVVQDVPAGVPVPREALSQVLWPMRVAPAEAFASLDSVAGRVTRVPIARGEPVRATALAPQGAAPGLEGSIAPDRRAIAVRVNEAAGVSGLVRPDSRVDVLVTTRGDNTGATARLVMADVRVLGVGPARPPEPKEGETREPMPANIASIVTLEVTPAQAALAAAAEQQGSVQVVLRGFGSRTPVPGAPDGLPEMAAVGLPAVNPSPEPVGVGGRFTIRAQGTSSARGPSSAFPVLRRPSTGAVAAHGTVDGAHTSPALVTTGPAAAPAASAVAAGPASPDSVTVRVYRGGQLTTMRVEATTPAAAPVARTAVLGGS